MRRVLTAEDVEGMKRQAETGITPAEALVDFLSIAGRLKSTPRTGWGDRGLPAERVESVADHSFRVALLAWIAAAADPTLDRGKVLLLALIHDLAEAMTGDHPPYTAAEAVAFDGEERTEFFNQRHLPDPEQVAAKRQVEAAAIEEMTVDLPQALQAEIRGLWQELEERTTLEARFVKQVDKLETYLQSREYEREQPGLPVQSFAAEVAEVIDVPVLIALRDAMADD
jgi:putative hydrolases of HD superfamily